ncbi:MAG: hypothetical protein ACU0CA_10935 [Paracoccaceae bacterium]
MAISDGHFKAAINIQTPSEPTEFPVELLYGVVGVLALVVIGGFVYWRRMLRQDEMAGG